jgi:hypothetical protein
VLRTVAAGRSVNPCPPPDSLPGVLPRRGRINLRLSPRAVAALGWLAFKVRLALETKTARQTAGPRTRHVVLSGLYAVRSASLLTNQPLLIPKVGLLYSPCPGLSSPLLPRTSPVLNNWGVIGKGGQGARCRTRTHHRESGAQPWESRQALSAQALQAGLPSP